MCLKSFHSKEKSEDHKTYCGEHNPVKITMPKLDENRIQFKNYKQSLKIRFFVYADFECMLQKIYTCRPSDKEANTNTKRNMFLLAPFKKAA